MNIESLFTIDTSVNISNYPSTHIADTVLNEHFESIKQANVQTGIDPTTMSRFCPGMTIDDLSFQAELKATRNGDILGSHFLVRNTDKTRVNEADIFFWKGVLEATSGRFRSPESKYLWDYQVTSSGLAVVTHFILEACAANAFEPVPIAQGTSLPA